MEIAGVTASIPAVMSAIGVMTASVRRSFRLLP
jgi:hypothetical protein